MSSESYDVVVIGSGSAALSAALRAAAGGLSVLVLEKTAKLGGTSAMSGAGTWIPANHHAKAAGLNDSAEEALTYLRAAAPKGWQESEDALWQAFAGNAAATLAFIETQTPLQFRLTAEPDTMAEQPGGKARGRMLSPLPLRRALMGPLRKHLRRSTLPHLYTYQEVYDGDLWHRPVRATLRVLHRLAWRILTGSRAQGSALVIGLVRGCLDHGCRFETGMRVQALLMGPDGRVTGAEASGPHGARQITARRGVVIASGGFEWDEAKRAAHFPGPLDFLGSPRANEGDGQRMAEAAGAALAHMDQANIYPAMPTRYEGKPHGIPLLFHAEPHAILVDRHGQRFVSELDFNIGEALDRRDPVTGEPLHLPAWVIADRRFLRLAPPFHWYARKKPGWLIKADSLATLAAKTGLPPQALIATVQRYNGFCQQGRDLDFRCGETKWERFKAGPKPVLAPIEAGPFYAMPLNRSILGTKGGARTDAQGRVLRADGTVIPGLFAAGLSMANPIGTRAVGPGTTIGPNLVWGYICGETLLAADDRP